MFEIYSYLKINEQFISISEFDGRIPDPDCIEGAIKMVADEQELIGFENWDYIDELWCYLAEGISQLIEEREFNTYFPDQPLKITLRPVSNARIVIEIADGTRSATVDQDEFIRVITEAGMLFFECMAKLLPTSHSLYQNMVEQLKILKDHSLTKNK